MPDRSAWDKCVEAEVAEGLYDPDPQPPAPLCSCGHAIEAHCYGDGTLKGDCAECYCKYYDGFLREVIHVAG